MIYFISNLKGSIKIGYTENIKRRLMELQISNPDILRGLYYIEDGDEKFEHHIHSICERYHQQGEWFDEKVMNHLFNHPYYKENIKVYQESRI